MSERGDSKTGKQNQEAAVVLACDDIRKFSVTNAINGVHICTVDAEQCQMILNVKHSIYDVANIPVEGQKLMLGGTVLQDEFPLASLPPGDIVELLLVHEQRVINGVLASFLVSASDELPVTAETEWDCNGAFSVLQVLGERRAQPLSPEAAVFKPGHPWRSFSEG